MVNELHNDKKQKKYCHLLCVFLFIPMINFLVNTILQIGMRVNTEFPFLSFITFFILVIIGIYTYLISFKKNIKLFIIPLIFFIGLLISIYKYPQLSNVIYSNYIFDPRSNMYKLMLYSLPTLFLATFINNYQKLYFVLIRYSIITLLIGIILYVYVAIIKKFTVEYMTYSYSIITSACFCLSYGLRNKKHKITILAITGFLCIIFGGARGALLGIIAYIILKIIDILKKSLVKSIIFSAVSSILFALIYFNFKNIILFLINIGDKLGIQTRTLNYILTDDLISDQGRIIMYETVWSQIKKSPIIGNGLFSDRYFINKYTSYGYVYTHNIALEILCHFGIIIGGIILLVLFYKLISIIFSKSDDVYYYEILYAIIPCGLIQLLFSGSYLSNITFYMLIGLLFKKKNLSNSDVIEEKKIG